jgi:hypothetical protein
MQGTYALLIHQLIFALILVWWELFFGVNRDIETTKHNHYIGNNIVH